MREFCAVDGEAYRDTGEYVLLASSDGDHVYNSDGLDTIACLEYLLQKRGRTVVAFGWNYDVNMILRDVPMQNLAELWKNHKTRWQGYTIEWIQGKWFSVRRKQWYVKVCDAFGFFQTSFVGALDKWGFQARDDIEEMKALRSEFGPAMRERLIRYCVNECVQLKQLMEALDKALRSAELKPRSWVGAGSIASALLNREGVKTHHVHDADFPEPVQRALLAAYFGGRSEVFQIGFFSKVWDYDISSAYPYQATLLPSLRNGKWSHATTFDYYEPYAVWHCRWNVDARKVLMPFPFRRDRTIFYPARGEGWYHSNEVQAAVAYHPEIEITEGWVFTPSTDHKPFDFVPRVYRERQRMKDRGDGGEKVLKLGMNAIYGKLAQGFGGKDDLPPFQSFFWAGRITAGCRALITEMGALHPDHLVMIATDGIFFDDPPAIAETEGLGGIELTVGSNVFVAQPGVYSYDEGEVRVLKSRGFFARELDWREIETAFRERGANAIVEYDSTRFCGLGYSMLTHDMERWRTWVTSPRKLKLYPSRKFVESNGGDRVRIVPPTAKHGELSEPYTPKSDVPMSEQEISELIEWTQGIEQPLREY